MGFTNIKKLLDKSLSRNGIKDQVFEKMAVSKFEEIKDVFFGRELADLMRPLYLKWGNLMVACLTQEAAEAIEVKQESLLGIINAELENIRIKNIKCLL